MNAGLAMNATRGAMRRLWSWLRQVSGDSAYEYYLEYANRATLGQKVISRSEFYTDCLRRQYSTPSRCC